MSIRELFVFCLCLVAGSGAAFSHTVAGGAIVSIKPGPDAYSHASGTVKDHDGSVAFGMIVDGTHKILKVYETVYPGLYVEKIYDQRDEEGSGQWSSILRKSATPDSCFKASFEGATGSVNHHYNGIPISYETGEPFPCTEPIERPENPSPIILDLDTNGFHLSGSENPVQFDFDHDGIPESSGWTSVGSGDAFLCRDRDGDGQVTNGNELFGNWTLLDLGVPAGAGYLALQELDMAAHGGDGDGWITETDDIYSDLCVWTDSNRDGISQSSEITGLGEAGILAIGYDFKASGRIDEHGNEFRYSGFVTLTNPAGQERTSVSYDVFFVSEQTP